MTGRDTEEDLDRILEAQRSAFCADGFPDAAVRKDRLLRLAALLRKHDGALCEAARDDFGSRPLLFSRFSEVAAVLGNIQSSIESLETWMQDECREPPLPFGQGGATGRVVYQPKGVVGIIGPWNYPAHLVLVPAVNAIAAGNRVMIKPSELTPGVTRVLQDGFSEFFDEAEAAVFSGGAEFSAAFSALPLDHLVFTGSTAVGRKVMRAAAANLVPVTLELGGKSPVIISRSADLERASRRLIAAKMMNSGQFCVSPDHVFVPSERMDEFVTACERAFARLYPHVAANPDYTSIINDHHFGRLQRMVDEANESGGRVVECNPASEDYDQAQSRKMLLKFIIDPAPDSAVMGEEIFGPIMAFLSYDAFDDVAAEIARGERPLAVYYYGQDEVEQAGVMRNTFSGGLTVNDCCWHVASHDLPLGGIGASGMGRYHGLEGFREFSNARSVLIQTPVEEIAGFFDPPFSPEMESVLKQIVEGEG